MILPAPEATKGFEETSAGSQFLKSMAPVFARLAIWHPKFGPVQERLRSASLQKITASDEGYLNLIVYKPGDDRTTAVLSIRKGESGVILSHTRVKSQLQPNSFVQIARKYLLGRKIRSVFATIDPVALFIEFEPSRAPESGDFPDTLILDLDTKPARAVIARKFQRVPERYQSSVPQWPHEVPFFESYCEWSLDSTKTKRRPTFIQHFLAYCCLVGPKSLSHGPIIPQEPPRGTELEKEEHEFGFAEKQAFEQKQMDVLKALSILPVHVRRAAKGRIQFLERRLLRQRSDLPPEAEITRLLKRGEGLRSNLYLWPFQSHTWYVPQELIETYGLPSFLTLKAGQKPSDLLEETFRQTDKLKRRRKELMQRIEDGKSEVEKFENKVTQAGESVEAEVLRIAPQGHYTLRELGIYFSRIAPAAALELCGQLEIPWSGAELKKNREKKRNETKSGAARVPYRVFRTSSGEFLHVARSAQEGDAMLKLMPSNHIWLHVLVGEGSHVWLEKRKKSTNKEQASAQSAVRETAIREASIREAAILAIHYSKLSRGKQGEVRVATRSDVEKKKDLPPGKVLIRRCTTLVVKYDSEELDGILSRVASKESKP